MSSGQQSQAQASSDIHTVIHRLCHRGDLNEIKRRFSQLSETQIEHALSLKRGQIEFIPIHAAATNGRVEVLDYLLERPCAEHLINFQTGNNGYTALHLAVISGHPHCVRVLLKHGADMKITDFNGKTAQQRAQAKKSTEIVSIFVSQGKLISL